MKHDSEIKKREIIRFSRSELIDILMESFQRQSGVLMKDIDKTKCMIQARGGEVHNLELIYTIDETSGKDYNGQ